jgi:hypothetical protein
MAYYGLSARFAQFDLFSPHHCFSLQGIKITEMPDKKSVQLSNPIDIRSSNKNASASPVPVAATASPEPVAASPAAVGATSENMER